MNPPKEILTLAEFCEVMQCSDKTVRRKLSRMPGVIRESRKFVRIHLPTYLAKRVKGF